VIYIIISLILIRDEAIRICSFHVSLQTTNIITEMSTEDTNDSVVGDLMQQSHSRLPNIDQYASVTTDGMQQRHSELPALTSDLPALRSDGDDDVPALSDTSSDSDSDGDVFDSSQVFPVSVAKCNACQSIHPITQKCTR